MARTGSGERKKGRERERGCGRDGPVRDDDGPVLGLLGWAGSAAAGLLPFFLTKLFPFSFLWF